jgi:hypothetical protein
VCLWSNLEARPAFGPHFISWFFGRVWRIYNQSTHFNFRVAMPLSGLHFRGAEMATRVFISYRRDDSAGSGEVPGDGRDHRMGRSTQRLPASMPLSDQQRMPTNNRPHRRDGTIILHPGSHPLPICARISRNGWSLARLPNLISARWRRIRYIDSIDKLCPKTHSVDIQPAG